MHMSSLERTTCFQSYPQGSLVYLRYHLKNKWSLSVTQLTPSMVPFYGQGMSGGFEDMNALTDALDGVSPTQRTPPPQRSRELWTHTPKPHSRRPRNCRSCTPELRLDARLGRELVVLVPEEHE
ncbi:hypothetical protein BJ742DRAFT_775038 [Cladochytrium replicatum]|nr:hypothetical protein BJ742DRAFT_775038 [Cladochytrium replicatum]